MSNGTDHSTLVLASGAMQVVIDPLHGARAVSLRADGEEFLVSEPHGNDELSWGMYPMVPYAGRVRGAVLDFGGHRYALRPNAGAHSIHGTVFDAPWTVLVHTQTTAILECALGPQWPFSGTARQYVGVDEGAVSFALEVLADEPMPAQVGWHPWFVPRAHVSVEFERMLVRDAEGIPRGDWVVAEPRDVDDCFTDATTWPRVSVGNVCVELRSDCDWWVVYDQSPRGICVEPQSGPPNGINHDPMVIRAKDSFLRTFDIVRVER